MTFGPILFASSMGVPPRSSRNPDLGTVLRGGRIVIGAASAEDEVLKTGGAALLIQFE